MSKLLATSRQWVEFDVHNLEHRKHYARFQQTGNWGSCPVRFHLPEDNGDLITMIQRKMIKYYMDQEFAGPM